MRDFLFSRFSRLYPSYWSVLAVLLAFDVLVRHSAPWWTAYEINATMLQKFVGMPNLDDVFWTLSVELAFYGVMTVVYVMGGLRYILPISAAWLIGTVIWSRETGFAGAPTAGTATYFIPYAPYFIAGIMFSLVRSRGVRLSFVAIILAAWIVVAAVNGASDAWMALLIFAIASAAVAGKLAFLNNPVTLWLGAISYPLYLIHRNLGYYLLNWFDARHLPYFVSLAVTVGLALFAATTISRYIERPSMRALRAWYASKFPIQKQPVQA